MEVKEGRKKGGGSRKKNGGKGREERKTGRRRKGRKEDGRRRKGGKKEGKKRKGKKQRKVGNKKKNSRKRQEEETKLVIKSEKANTKTASGQQTIKEGDKKGNEFIISTKMLHRKPHDPELSHILV